MNTALMSVKKFVLAALALVNHWLTRERKYQEAIEGIESLTGDRFGIWADHPDSFPELSFYDFTGKLLTVGLYPGRRMAMWHEDEWLGVFSPSEMLQEVWTSIRGR